MIGGLFGVRFLFSDIKRERCSIDDYSSILQRPLLNEDHFLFLLFPGSRISNLSGNETDLLDLNNLAGSAVFCVREGDPVSGLDKRKFFVLSHLSCKDGVAAF